MSGRTNSDRAPLVAGAGTGVAMAAMFAFWALFALIGGNGFNGADGTVWLGGNLVAVMLAWIIAPIWAARRCAAWRRGRWSAGAAIVASILLALAASALALFAIALALAAVPELL